jgi:hypothetical protein
MKARVAMKELLLSVNLAELKCIDVADVVGSSLQEQVRKLVHYAYEDDSWIDDDHTELLWRCKLLLDCDDDTYKKEDTFKGEEKADFQLNSLLQRANNLIKQDGETYVPTQSLATRHSSQARGLNIPKYEFLIGVEQLDCTASAPFDIKSIATMVSPFVRSMQFIRKQTHCAHQLLLLAHSRRKIWSSMSVRRNANLIL